MSVKYLAQVMSVTIGFFSVVATAAEPQSVYSLKNLGSQKNSSGATIKRTQVKCTTHNQFVYIIRDSRVKKWCVEGYEDKCSKERIGAARAACMIGLEVIVANDTDNVQPAKADVNVVEPKVSEAELLAAAKRKKLEEELLLTQQREIEIKAQQLDLRKKELELIKQQD